MRKTVVASSGRGYGKADRQEALIERAVKRFRAGNQLDLTLHQKLIDMGVDVEALEESASQ